MSAVKPLAEVSHGRLCVGAAAFAPGNLDRSELEWQAKHINEAHWQAMAPLLAKLAQAREALADRMCHCDECSCTGCGSTHPPCPSTRAMASIDAASPGEWVPASRLKECQRVLADALEEKGDVYKRRCERALEALERLQSLERRAPGSVASWAEPIVVAVKAALEGREPPTAREATPYGLSYVEREEGEP